MKKADLKVGLYVVYGLVGQLRRVRATCTGYV